MKTLTKKEKQLFAEARQMSQTGELLPGWHDAKVDKIKCNECHGEGNNNVCKKCKGQGFVAKFTVFRNSK